MKKIKIPPKKITQEPKRNLVKENKVKRMKKEYLLRKSKLNFQDLQEVIANYLEKKLGL